MIKALALLAVLGLAGFWAVTTPIALTVRSLPERKADIANGERMYNVSGCHSCHLPDPASGIDTAIPAGGKALKTPIGTLYPPNLTFDDTGLGGWKESQFIDAMQYGKGPAGENLIPAFPYTSYVNMTEDDVRDIWAYLATLPKTKNAAPAHDVLGLPGVRRGLTFWKWIGLAPSTVAADPSQSESWNRGRYLVEGAGHCNECHTPRTVFMTSDRSNYLAGGPHPDGDGKVPSLRDLTGRKRYKDAADLASAFEFGEVMGYDKMSSGGMAAVQGNLAKLPASDRQAIADYLMTLK